MLFLAAGVLSDLMEKTAEQLKEFWETYEWMKAHDVSVRLKDMKRFLRDIGCKPPEGQQKRGRHENWTHDYLLEAPDSYFCERILHEREPRYIINVANYSSMIDVNVRKILEKVHVILRVLEDEIREGDEHE